MLTTLPTLLRPRDYNRFSVLGDLSSIPSIDSCFSPTTYSSPKPNFRLPSTDSDHSSTHNPTAKYSNLRILLVNCQCIRNKRTALSESVDYLKPDVIIGKESWLGPEHGNSEFFPEGFQSNVIRKDRDKNGGGVFIAIHDKIQGNEVKEPNKTGNEVAWAEIKTRGKTDSAHWLLLPPSKH